MLHVAMGYIMSTLTVKCHSSNLVIPTFVNGLLLHDDRFLFASRSKTMMTHGESAAQTRRGILLSNSAASAQQRRSGLCPPTSSPPLWDIKAADTLRDGWKQGKKAGGWGESKNVRWRTARGKNKSNVAIHRGRMWEIDEGIGCD